MDKIISKLLEIKWLASIKANTAPRWMVLFVDLIIISCSYLLLATSEAFIPGHSISSLRHQTGAEAAVVAAIQAEVTLEATLVVDSLEVEAVVANLFLTTIMQNI